MQFKAKTTAMNTQLMGLSGKGEFTEPFLCEISSILWFKLVHG